LLTERHRKMDADTQQAELTRKRPVSVTIISWLLIIHPFIGFIVLSGIVGRTDIEFNLLNSIQIVMAFVVPFVMGVGMLKGQDWARVLFLWLIVFSIINEIMVALHFHTRAVTLLMVIVILFQITFAVFLLTPAASAYFFNQSMLKFFLRLRYLRKKKIVFLSIAAVALSVSLLIVVASLFTGFINAFEQAAVEAIGDVVIGPPAKFAKYPLLIERLEQTSVVQAATATLSAPGLLHLPKGNVRPVEIWGIEAGPRTKVTRFKQALLRQKNSADEPSFDIPDSPEKTGGFVGIGVLGEPDEKTDQYDFGAVEQMLGRQVYLTTGIVSDAQERQGPTPEFRRKTIVFSIADAIFTGVYPLDKELVYLPIEELQRRLYPGEDSPIAGQIQIKLREDVETDVALAVIRGVWQSFVEEQLGADPYLIRYTIIETAKQMQIRYVAAYRQQMGILLLIFGVVSFGVVLLILCIFYMIVRLKQKDIAIIKSCGATSSSVAFIFVGFGICVGVVGSGIGTVLGYVITKNVNTIEGWIRIIFGLKLWKSSVYMFDKIPNQVNWFWSLRIVLLAIIAAAIGTLIPAIVAARTKPVEILRYE